MKYRFSIKTVGVLVILVYTFGISFINFTYALICFECEDETCDIGPINITECEHETSVCVLFMDVTGRALNLGPNHVYKRACGVATYPNNKSDWNCTLYTTSFDKCLCRADLCNGDESLMDLITTTVHPSPVAAEEESSKERLSGENDEGQMGRDFGPRTRKLKYPVQRPEKKKCNHKPGNGQGKNYNNPHYSADQQESNSDSWNDQQGGYSNYRNSQRDRNSNYRNNQRDMNSNQMSNDQGRYSNRDEDYYGDDQF